MSRIPNLASQITMIAMLALVRPLFAQDHQLVMTQTSPLDLTVTYDGSSAGITVVPGSPNTWLVTFPTTTHLGFELDWQEPNDPTLVNDFNIYPPDIGASNTWIVSSEFMLPGGPSQDEMQYPDGHTFTQIGGDFLDFRQIDATYNDAADNIEAVPESGTWTVGFLTTFAVACLFWRRRSVRTLSGGLQG